MHIEQALTQIRNTIFKPGWKISARPVEYGKIRIIFRVETVDTSYPNDATGEYHVPADIEPIDKVVTVEHMNEVGLCFALLEMAAEVDSHENREFLRIRQPDGSWKAPLHPHNTDGEINWLTSLLMASPL